MSVLFGKLVRSGTGSLYYRTDQGNRLAFYVDPPEDDDEPDPGEPPDPDPVDPEPDPDPEDPFPPVWRSVSVSTNYTRTKHASVSLEGTVENWPDAETPARIAFLNSTGASYGTVVRRTRRDPSAFNMPKTDAVVYASTAWSGKSFRPTDWENNPISEYTKITMIKLRVLDFGGDGGWNNAYNPRGWVHFDPLDNTLIPSWNWSYWTSGTSYILPRANGDYLFNFNKNVGNVNQITFHTVGFFEPQRAGIWTPSGTSSELRRVYGHTRVAAVLWEV